MVSSLTLAGHLELLGGGVVSANPACAGATFRLDDGWDLGAPVPVPELLASLTLDGEIPSGRRVSNRTLSVPVLIQAPTLLLVEAAREVLLQAVAAERWTMTWTPDPEGGTPLPMVIDCYAASATVPVYSITDERDHLARLTLTIPAAPYGRSDLPVEIDFPAPVTGRPAPPAPVTVDDFGSVTNWLTGQNSGFEGGIGTWVPGTNCTVAGTSAQAHTGSSALAMTSAAAGNMSAQHCTDANAQVQGGPCAAGDAITVTMWFRAATVIRACQVGAAFYGTDNTRLSTSFGPSTNNSASAWTQVSSPFTVPANAVRWVAVASVLATGAAGEVHYVDDVAGPTTLTPAQWSQSLTGPGAFSAHWDPSASPASNPAGTGMAPFFTKTGLSLDLAQGWIAVNQGTAPDTSTFTFPQSYAPPLAVGDRFQLLANFLAGDSSTFEGGIANWAAAANCAVAQTAAQAHGGTKSLALTSVAGGNMSAQHALPAVLATLAMRVSPGDAVFGSAWFRAATVARQCQIGAAFYDAAGNPVGSAFSGSMFNVSSVPDTTTGWTQATGQWVAPASAAWALAVPQVLATGAGGEVHYVDDVVLAGRGSPLLEAPVHTVTAVQQPFAGFQNFSFTPAAAVVPAVGVIACQTGPSKVPALTVYAGFGSTQFFRNWARAGGAVQFQFTLTDGVNTVAFSVTRKGVKGSNRSGAPLWYKVRAPVPQGTAVNMRAVTGYSVRVVNQGTNALPYTDLYLDSLTAQPMATAVLAAQRGVVHELAGLPGTARGPASWQFQQQGAGTLVTKVYDQPGTYYWLCPPGVSSYAGFAGGAGGDGGPFQASGGGGGSGGSSAQDGAVAVTQGQLYQMVVGQRGSSGVVPARNGGPSSFSGDTVTRVAPGGITTTAVSGAAAPAAGFGGFAGGTGGNGTGTGTGGGGAGGGSGGTGAAGNPGGAASGGTGGTPGAAVAGGGIGGKGGTFGLGNGLAPPTGYGGGMGGSPANGTGRRDYGGHPDGVVRITYLQPPQAKTLIVHQPGYKAPDTLCPFVSVPVTDVPDGTTEYPVQSMVPGSNARFDGTYTVLAVSAAWNNPSASRNVFVTVKQYEQPGGTMNAVSTVTKSFVPNTDPDVSKNGIVNLGEITLPDKKIPAENLAALFTLTITDSNTSDDWYDVLLCDTRGSLVIVNSTVPYTNYFVDEPGEIDFGPVMGSGLDRTDAVSVTSQCLAISGPPLGVDPEGCPYVLVYAVDGNGAPAVYMTTHPRWRVSRTA